MRESATAGLRQDWWWRSGGEAVAKCIKFDTFVIVTPFGETVLLWRLDRGLTQAELARAARVSRPNLSAIERGERDVTLGTLRSLALALEIKPGVLADGVAPHGDGKPLSRAALERVAEAAISGETLSDATERKLSVLLGAIVSSGTSTRRKTGTRDASLSYLQLKSRVSPEVFASLLTRAHEARERR
jgi:transcriptional regulator with XRE-family HTH domain